MPRRRSILKNVHVLGVFSRTIIKENMKQNGAILPAYIKGRKKKLYHLNTELSYVISMSM